MVADSSPLTFGQMSTLRHLQKWPRERWPEGNLIHEHVITPGVTVGDVTSALDTLVRHHVALRTTFDLGDPRSPVQILHDNGSPDTLVVAGGGDASTIEAQIPSTNFTYDTDRGWRVFLLLGSSGEPAKLVLCLSHLLFDGWSARHLDLALAPLRGDEHFDWEHPVTSFLRTTDLCRLQRGEQWRDRRLQAEGYWRSLFVQTPARLLSSVGVGAAAEAVVHGRLKLQSRQDAISAIGRAARAFPAGILLAFLALAMLENSPDEEFLMFALMSANRNLHPWRDLVTTMNQQIPVLLGRPGTGTVLDYVADVQRAALRAYRNGCYDVDMADRVATDILSYIPQSFGPLVNFTAHGHPGARTGGPAESGPDVVVQDAEAGIPTDLFIQISNANGLTLDLSAVRGLMADAAVRGILTWISRALSLTAADPSLRVSDLPKLEIAP